MVLDEGGIGGSPTAQVAYALPATAEKGAVDVVLTRESPGGHSSRPPAHTSIGIMSKLIGERIVESRGDRVRWQIQTSQAVDEIRRGDKDDQLPEEVTAIRRGEVLAEVAHDFGIAVSGLGSSENRTASGILKPPTSQLLVPSPITLMESTNDVWNLVGGTLRQVYQSVDSLPEVKTVIPLGSIATGNSDTSHCWNSTEQIYRFTPMREDARQDVHTVDERIIEMPAHLEATRVDYDLMRNFQKFEGETCEDSCPIL